MAVCLMVVGAIAYGIYLRETTGVDPWQTAMTFVYVENAHVSVPLSIGVLIIGLFLAWVRFMRGGRFGVKPFLVVAAVIALALLGWVQTNDI
jgi:hypothetical protein